MFRRNPEILWRPLRRGVAVLRVGSDEPLELQGLAAWVWLALEEPTEALEVQAELLDAGIDLGDISSSGSKVLEVFTDLAERGLVEPC